MKNKIVEIIANVQDFLIRQAAFLFAIAFIVGMTMVTGHAALDTDITGAVTDVSGLWDTVKELILGVVIFGIAIAFLRRSKSK